MGFFRRKQATLNDQLLHEAGLDPAQMLGAPPPAAPQPLEQDWDATATVTVPALTGDRVEFTTLPNGDLVVGEESGDPDLTPLADAVERHLSPPYRAVAQRQDGDLWGVAAKRIEAAQFEFPDGDKLEFSQHAGQGELRVDAEASDAAVPVELERLGETLGESFYVHAERIDSDYWEVRATAL